MDNVDKLPLTDLEKRVCEVAVYNRCFCFFKKYRNDGAKYNGNVNYYAHWVRGSYTDPYTCYSTQAGRVSQVIRMIGRYFYITCLAAS